MAEEQHIPGYDDPVQEPEELSFKTIEYRMPFNYRNITVNRAYQGGEWHGVETFPIKTHPEDKATSCRPADYIEIRQEDPIARVVVIGSACTPPGWVGLECDPIEGFRRPNEVTQTIPARFRIDGLWGMHLRWDQWSAGPGEKLEMNHPGHEYYPEELPPGQSHNRLKAIDREFPQLGMSCAVFEIPQSRTVRILAGSQVPGWTIDNFPDDVHYSIRVIRTTTVV